MIATPEQVISLKNKYGIIPEQWDSLAAQAGFDLCCGDYALAALLRIAGRDPQTSFRVRTYNLGQGSNMGQISANLSIRHIYLTDEQEKRSYSSGITLPESRTDYAEIGYSDLLREGIDLTQHVLLCASFRFVPQFKSYLSDDTFNWLENTDLARQVTGISGATENMFRGNLLRITHQELSKLRV